MNNDLLEMHKEAMEASRMFRANVDPKRKQELADSRLIQENRNSMSNLEQKPVYHTWNPDQYVQKINFFNQDLKTRR